MNVEDAIKLSNNIRQQGQKIVLAGGCFDILHVGHIVFLEKAKQTGDILIILLESDEAVKKTKGENRPINTQEDRATILKSLEIVDYVVLLEQMLTDLDYDGIIHSIQPSVLATTKGDPNRQHKERQAVGIHAKLIDVTEKIADKSTSKLAQILSEKFNL